MKKVNVAVAVIVNEKNQILLTQRNSPESPSIHLRWQLPGGEVNKTEETTDACIREVKEETGYKVTLLSQIPKIISHPYGGKEYILHGFKARIVSGTINTKLDEETADAKWVPLEKIKELSTLDDTSEMVEMCLI